MHDPDQLKTFVERWYELWNLNDRAGWLQHMRSVAPGDPSIEDPVGQPVKGGWSMMEELWDRTGDDHFPITIQRVFVCGNEIAAVCLSEGTFRGAHYSVPSVDIHQFRGDTWAVRAYWNIQAMGDLPYRAWTSAAGEPVG